MPPIIEGLDVVAELVVICIAVLGVSQIIAMRRVIGVLLAPVFMRYAIGVGWIGIGMAWELISQQYPSEAMPPDYRDFFICIGMLFMTSAIYRAYRVVIGNQITPGER